MSKKNLAALFVTVCLLCAALAPTTAFAAHTQNTLPSMPNGDGDIWLPKGTTVVEEQAFMDSLKGYMYVYMPYGAKTIKSKAFANTGIEWIGLPSTLTYIAPDAFSGSSNVWAVVEKGSYAYNWCNSNGVYPYVIDGGLSISMSSAKMGETVTCSCEASDTYGVESYQWQQSSNNSTWTNCTLSGNKTSTMSFTANSTTMNRYYRCVVTDNVNQWYSNSVKPVVVGEGTVYRALLIGEVAFNPVCNRNWGDVNLMSSMLASRKGPTGASYSVVTKKDPTPSQIKSAISTTFAGADNDDVSLFFIATHGDASSTGTYAGALATSSGDFLLLYELANALNAIPGKVIVILESCGSGAAVYDPTVAQNNVEAFNNAAISAFSSLDTGVVEKPYIEYDKNGVEIEDSSNTGEFRKSKFYVLTASRYLQLSWGTEQGPYNFFTYDLTNGVGTSGNMPADVNYGNSDGYVTLNELFQYIKTIGDARSYSYQGSTVHQNVQVYPTGSSYQLFKR